MLNFGEPLIVDNVICLSLDNSTYMIIPILFDENPDCICNGSSKCLYIYLIDYMFQTK